MAVEYSLGGHVIAPPSGPVEGVRVRVSETDPEAEGYLGEDRTDGEGEFSVTFGKDEFANKGIGEPMVLLELYEGDRVAYDQEVTLSGGKTSVTLMTPSLEGFEPVTPEAGDGSDGKDGSDGSETAAEEPANEADEADDGEGASGDEDGVADDEDIEGSDEADGDSDEVVQESGEAVEETADEREGDENEPTDEESLAGDEEDEASEPTAEAEPDGETIGAADGEAESAHAAADGATVAHETPDSGASMGYHGIREHRGMTNVPRDPSRSGQGRFGRLFPNLPAADHDVEFLEALGLPGDVLDEGEETPETVESVPAGVVFLGQFVDHDITLDPLSSLSRQADPDAVRNFRTPGLDLDSVYGAGPEVDPFLYQSPFGDGSGTGDSEKFLLGVNDAGEYDDLPRTRDDTAIVADARNDENLVLSQFQHVMLKFHNRIVDWLREERGDGGSEAVFAEAQRLARWHYQWIVLDEYLPAVCDEHVVETVREEGRRFYTVDRDDERYIPVEFAGAAHRFGHSQARRWYRVNDEFGEGVLFGRPDEDGTHLGRDFQPVSREQVVDWRHLFDIDSDPQPARAIDPKLSADRLELPFVPAEEPAFERSLASRNLVRGRRLGLPSGQAVARRLGVDPLDNEAVGFEEALRNHSQPPDAEAPLWYYVLGEASHESGGAHLGPVGSRIVAEVVVGLVEIDPRSFATVQPGWEPTLPAPHSEDGEFTAADLVAFALEY